MLNFFVVSRIFSISLNLMNLVLKIVLEEYRPIDLGYQYGARMRRSSRRTEAYGRLSCPFLNLV